MKIKFQILNIMYGLTMIMAVNTTCNSHFYQEKLSPQLDFCNRMCGIHRGFGSAYNNYQKSTTSGIKLCSWVENVAGTNCTYKTNYSSYQKVVMDYKNKASDYKEKYLHLNISTQGGELNAGVVSGTWTPN